MKFSHQQSTKLVIFDFDGTIADTSEGILDSHRFALKAMGREIPDENILKGVIGGNLLKTYIEKFAFEEKEARKAVQIYRARYAEVGIHKAVLYVGFIDLLKSLREDGCMIGVATLKAEKFAKVMLEEMDIAQYFDAVCGIDENDALDKAGLILKCCELCGIKKENAVLVGDSDNDWHGAQKAEVEFIGVTYGFGFRKDKTDYEFETADNTKVLYGKLKVYMEWRSWL